MNAVFSALDLILHGPSDPSNRERIRANPDIVLLDYCDPATFSDLWLCDLEMPKAPTATDEKPMRQRRVELRDSSKQYLIIGNDPPDGIFDTKIPALAGINFCSHFTATSWLAAWKVKWGREKDGTAGAEKAQREKENGLPRIAVIDPRPAETAQGAALALQTILSALDTSGLPLVPGATVLNAPSLDSICQWLAEESVSRQAREDRQGNESESLRTPRLLRKTSESTLNLLRSTIWNELTSNREHNHAVSNVLGAMLLWREVSGTEQTTEGIIQRLLDSLKLACGLKAMRGSIDSDMRWIAPTDQHAFSSVILIDDMSDLWKPFLCGALSAGSNIVAATKTASLSIATFSLSTFQDGLRGLGGRLVRFLEEGRCRLLASDLLGEEAGNLGEDYVLFLDLRLFGTKEKQLANHFYSSLLGVARKMLEIEGRKLPWLPSAAAFSTFQEDVNGSQGHLYPRETLLPRLLSLLDPTLPIVVFSSTHRTELIEPFSEFGNLITGFHKPVLGGMGDWATEVAGLRTDFYGAMEKASRILAVRKFLRELELKEEVA